MDQLRLGELSASEATTVRAQIGACSSCEARFVQFEAGLESFSELDAASLVARIHQSTAHVDLEESASIWSRLLRVLRTPRGLGTSFAIATAMVFMVVQPPKISTPSDYDQLRLKGSSGLVIYREHQGAIDVLRAGTSAHPGDRLRFELSGFQDGQIVVFGAEANAKLYPIYPLRLEHSVAYSAKRQGPLPGAIALDSSLGQEWLYLIHCPESFTMDDISVDIPNITAPTGCEVTSFTLNKAME